MVKRVFIVHGWEGYPEEGWFPWLRKELEKQGFQVDVPAMPNSDEPKIDAWISFLKQKIRNADEETFLVGHSIGCQAILRYLETLPENQKIGGVVFVAGWVHLIPEAAEEEEEIAKPWLETPINWNRIKTHTNNFIVVFSDNDPYVPIGDSKIFEDKLNAKIIIKHEKGHFRGSDNITKLPVVLNELLRITK